jgi:diketogulonate reductase-like aldo/keto reductase
MKLQDEGKVRMIGMSNTYDVKILVALQKARKVQVVQNRWYEGNKWDKQVFNYCHQHEIMYQCVSCSFFLLFLYILGFRQSLTENIRSFWTLTGSPSLVGSPAIARIAEDSSLTPAQAVLRHAQMRGVVPLSGTTDESHMRQDLELENCSLKGLESSWKEVRQIMGD